MYCSCRCSSAAPADRWTGRVPQGCRSSIPGRCDTRACIRSSILAPPPIGAAMIPAPCAATVQVHTRQRRITSHLPEIDAALAATGKDQAWLHRKIQSPPFSRRTPLEHMAHGMEGMAEALQILNRTAMQAALSKRGS